MTGDFSDGTVSAEVEVHGGERTPPPRWERYCVAALLVYFLMRLLYLAATIGPEIPPDESTHLGIVGLYADAPLMIQDSPKSYSFGLVTRTPYLYYFVLGKLSALNVVGLDGVLYLRLINVLLAMLTVVAGYRLAVRLIDNPLARVLFFVMATNTLMFTFIGAAVSYDNLVNLLAVLAMSSLVAFVRDEEPKDLALFLLWNLLGILTKTTFLPLTLVLLVLLVFDRRWRLGEDIVSGVRLVSSGRPAGVGFASAIVLMLVTNVMLYGTNLFRYGRLEPSCDQVLELDQCMENRIFARNWVVIQYRDGALDYSQAVAATGRIDHPGDRDHAIRLLNNERAYKQAQPKPLPRWDFIGEVWNRAMKPTIFGVQAHVSMVKDPWALLPYNLILFAAFVLWVRGSRWDGSERVWAYLAVVSAFYFLFLIGFVNYRNYLSSHAPFLGVQGRYLFPVLIPAYLMAARYLLEPFRRGVQVAVVAVVATVFVLGDAPYFKRNAGPAWFVGNRPAPVETRSGQPSH